VASCCEYGDGLSGSSTTELGVIATWQENCLACHFGHSCHSFTSSELEYLDTYILIEKYISTQSTKCNA
jgi:hypothetical protein